MSDRVLLVDDNLTNLQVLYQALEEDPATEAFGKAVGKLVRAFDFGGLDKLVSEVEN